MPDDLEETSIETPPETPVETRIDEAENTAEIAIEIADDISMRLDELHSDIVALGARIQVLESELSNDRTNAGSEPIAIGDPIDNPAETKGAAPEVSIIKPRREHPYFRKLW